MNYPQDPDEQEGRHNHRGMGRGMIVIASILALAMLTWFFDGVLDRQTNPNRSPDSRATAQFNEVTLVANRQDQYVVSARLNGLEVPVLVDTGATSVAVSQSLARQLDLPRGRTVMASTANGVVEAYETRLNEISVGSITLYDVSASVVPNMSAPDVLLGMTFLRDLEMIQRDGMLILRQY